VPSATVATPLTLIAEFDSGPLAGLLRAEREIIVHAR
jgi:hypothetical protein